MSKINSKYYELNKIPTYRNIIIDRAVKTFKKDFNIKNIPVDCVKIVLNLNKQKGSNIRFKSTTVLPHGVLGRTIYIRDNDFYVVSINRSQLFDPYKKRIKYPYIYSSDRILNFTIAHEFGHIYLHHAEIPDADKTDEIKEEEHLEANEFAGRLLMPKSSFENCNFPAISEVAEEYLVSEQAVLKRLTHLDRHDKRSSKANKVCPNCWNPNIEAHHVYCSICGVPLNSKKGVITMHYSDGFKTDHLGRVFPCPKCSNSDYTDADEYCRICGTELYNKCTNDYCTVVNIGDGCSRYCYKCGSQTTFLCNGLLKDWQPSKETILSIQDAEDDIWGSNASPTIIDNWGYLIYQLNNNLNTRLSNLLDNTNAKYYNKKLLISVRSKDIKNYLEQSKYHEELKKYSKTALGLDIEEIHIICYEEFIPESKKDNLDEIPF